MLRRRPGIHDSGGFGTDLIERDGVDQATHCAAPPSQSARAPNVARRRAEQFVSDELIPSHEIADPTRLADKLGLTDCGG